MRNDIIPVSKPTAPPLEEYISEISDIWENRIFTNIGEKITKLEEKLCQYLNVPYISLFANGHLALESALSGLNLKGEVITTPFTFTSTALAIVRNNLKPIFCDIKESDYTINCDLIESLITDKTCAILPVHIYGNVCDVKKIESISKKYNIPVIYDAAHAFGIIENNISIGNYGDVSMFSFHATKVFHTIEGGGLVYQDPKFKIIFTQMRNFGIEHFDTVRIGANLKMSEIHAAMGLCNLRYIDKYIENRYLCVQQYEKKLSNIKGIYINQYKPQTKSNYSYYPVRIVREEFGFSRDEIYDILIQNNIYARKYYYPLVSQFPIYDRFYELSETAVANKVSSQILTLPLYADLKIEDVNKICDIIIERFHV
jgi:dTDP-4-amino-4,6-dideoxygalactose transaminase